MSRKKYTDNKLVVFGGLGAATLALCCFTPLLVWGLAALGLVGLVAYVDYALLPLLPLALGITYLGIRQVSKQHETSCDDNGCEVPAT